MKAIIKNEVGREKNPYQSPLVENIDPNSKYWNFEQSVIEYPAPGIEDGECEVYLQWQKQKPTRSDWDDCDESDMDYLSEFGYSFRQIFKLLPISKEGEGDKGEVEPELKPYFAQISGNMQIEVDAVDIYDAFRKVLEAYKNSKYHQQAEFNGYDISCRVWCSYGDATE